MIKLLPTDRQGVKEFVQRLNYHGFPVAWSLRAAVLRLIAQLYDAWFLLSSVSRQSIYTLGYHGSRFNLRRGTGDKYVVDEIWVKRDYGDPPTGVVVDFGGNIGAYAVYAAQNAERVVTLEPVRSNYNLLIDNLALNHVSNVSPIMTAVSSSAGEKTINISPVNLGRSSFLSVGDNSQKEVITCTTVDALFRELGLTHVNLLKCDIEGGEFYAFPRSSLRALSIVDSIIMEIHCNQVTPMAVYRLLRTMQRSGFTITFENPVFLFRTGLGMIRFTR